MEKGQCPLLLLTCSGLMVEYSPLRDLKPGLDQPPNSLLCDEMAHLKADRKLQHTITGSHNHSSGHIEVDVYNRSAKYYSKDLFCPRSLKGV